MSNEKLTVMNAKKSEKSNLENKKFLFFEIGLAIALALGLVALEWSSADNRTNPFDDIASIPIDEELDIEITRPELKEVLPPPPLEPKIVIRDNKIEIPEDYKFEDIDVRWDESVFAPLPTDEDTLEVINYVFFAQQMPQYRKGDLTKFHKYIQETVEYPAKAIELGIEGKVFVRFIVDTKGYVTGIDIMSGVDPLLDNAVIAAVEKSERWKPGKQNGRPVNVAMSMPVLFRLQ